MCGRDWCQNLDLLPKCWKEGKCTWCYNDEEYTKSPGTVRGNP